MLADLQLIVYSYLELEEALILLKHSSIKSKFTKTINFNSSLITIYEDNKRHHLVKCDIFHNESIEDNIYNSFEEYLCYQQVGNGNLETAIYLIEKYNIPFDTIFLAASEHGHLKMIKYIISRGFVPEFKDIYKRCFLFASRKDDIKIIKYLDCQNFFTDYECLRNLHTTIRDDAINCFSYFLSSGITPVSKTLFFAVKYERPLMVKILLDRGLKPTKEMLKLAKKNNNPDILKLLKIKKSCCIIL